MPLFLAELEFQFALECMEHPIRIIVAAQCYLDVSVFLF